MHFELTDDQEQLRDLVAEFFTDRFPADRLRATWEERIEKSGIWADVADLGVMGLSIPEELGGLGVGYLETLLAIEGAAHAGFTEPLLETAGIAAPFLQALRGPAAEEWLPSIASGEVVFSVADASGYASFGQEADAVLVPTADAVHLVTRGTAQWTPLRTQDPTRRLARVDVDALSAGSVVATGAGATALIERHGRAATASALVGLSRRILEMTIAYVIQREQFGQPLGAFQVVKHRLADLGVKIEAARVLSWYAGYTLGEDRPDAELASLTSKASANAAARFANRNGLQLHGGIGFTWEYDLHFWLMRGQAWESTYGREPELRVAIGRSLLNDGIRIVTEDATAPAP
ncbi:acyl-CoA/acyl-ACP dehydrogenase [Microbacterium sp. zg.B48]|uniref:acyl-CoA dehydrogenase family protein n=1 Tax=Microbacterium sp. zg.B48 TaxID=2969408 RepID=UPI00214B202A|nr:acyl-CoA dehydrogenase family protein [Microbacterium sp. zg.B48]MCR2764323.1 acyl-CoA/acyl-ACP dehydrogenase [Microbacterium sp. zg.B48]